jgi:hypothetical protein
MANLISRRAAPEQSSLFIDPLSLPPSLGFERSDAFSGAQSLL